jgi:hypothetical protein
VLLPATHLTSLLSGRPRHHIHPTPSPLDTPTHLITSAPASGASAMPKMSASRTSALCFSSPSGALLTWAAGAPSPLPALMHQSRETTQAAADIGAGAGGLLHGVCVLPLWSSLQRCKGQEMVPTFMERQLPSETFWKTSPSCGCHQRPAAGDHSVSPSRPHPKLPSARLSANACMALMIQWISPPIYWRKPLNATFILL